MSAYATIYGCKLVREGTIAHRPKLVGQERAFEIANAYFHDVPSEEVVSIMLDTKLKIIGMSVITRGILDASLVHPREVFRSAILANAARIIIAHNHPSGDVSPSGADIQVRDSLLSAGKIMGIPVVDFIIVDGMGATNSLMA